MQNKKTILIFVDWFLPGYKAGGPIRSVANLVNILHNHFNFKIITSNTDFNDKKPYENIIPDKWTDHYGCKIYYISKKNLSLSTLKHLIKNTTFDKIYLNSLFSVYFTLIPLFFLKKKTLPENIILAPRGMLGKGALKIKSLKKKIFLSIVKFTKFMRKIKWHASTKYEAEEIKKTFGNNANICIATNLSTPIAEQVNCLEKNKNTVRFLFLSRISPVKNLDFALRVLQKTDTTDGNIKFQITGPVEDAEYWQSIQPLMRNLKNKIEINYTGSKATEKTALCFQENHFLFLPTKSENFGHVIVEALSNGCPVIISNNTPWKNLEAENAGWNISLDDEQKFLDVLKLCLETDNKTYREMQVAALQYIKKRVNTPEIIKQNKTLFQ